MDIWENASLTEKGADLQNKLINVETLKITKVKTGAGKVSAMYLRQQTEVANPVQELTIQPATIADDNIIIPVLLDNIGLTESYELWQVGFYAEDPDEGEQREKISPQNSRVRATRLYGISILKIQKRIHLS